MEKGAGRETIAYRFIERSHRGGILGTLHGGRLRESDPHRGDGRRVRRAMKKQGKVEVSEAGTCRTF